MSLSIVQRVGSDAPIGNINFTNSPLLLGSLTPPISLPSLSSFLSLSSAYFFILYTYVYIYIFIFLSSNPPAYKPSTFILHPPVEQCFPINFIWNRATSVVRCPVPPAASTLNLMYGKKHSPNDNHFF